MIRQQRQRARDAQRRASVVYRFLILTVLIGIVFYLGLPFLRDALDGRRLALKDSISAAENTLRSLDAEVVTLSDSLAAAFPDAAQRVPLPDDLSEYMEFYGVSEDIAGVRLIWGTDSTLLRNDPAGGTTQRVPLPDGLSKGVLFYGVSEDIAGGRLIWGSGSTLLSYDPGGL